MIFRNNCNIPNSSFFKNIIFYFNAITIDDLLNKYLIYSQNYLLFFQNFQMLKYIKTLFNIRHIYKLK